MTEEETPSEEVVAVVEDTEPHYHIQLEVKRSDGNYGSAGLTFGASSITKDNVQSVLDDGADVLVKFVEAFTKKIEDVVRGGAVAGHPASQIVHANFINEQLEKASQQDRRPEKPVAPRPTYSFETEESSVDGMRMVTPKSLEETEPIPMGLRGKKSLGVFEP